MHSTQTNALELHGEGSWLYYKHQKSMYFRVKCISYPMISLTSTNDKFPVDLLGYGVPQELHITKTQLLHIRDHSRSEMCPNPSTDGSLGLILPYHVLNCQRGTVNPCKPYVTYTVACASITQPCSTAVVRTCKWQPLLRDS